MKTLARLTVCILGPMCLMNFILFIHEPAWEVWKVGMMGSLYALWVAWGSEQANGPLGFKAPFAPYNKKDNHE